MARTSDVIQRRFIVDVLFLSSMHTRGELLIFYMKLFPGLLKVQNKRTLYRVTPKTTQLSSFRILLTVSKI
jgi:hypothetical protein